MTEPAAQRHRDAEAPEPLDQHLLGGGAPVARGLGLAAAREVADHDPAELVANLIKTERKILGLLEELQGELAGGR